MRRGPPQLSPREQLGVSVSRLRYVKAARWLFVVIVFIAAAVIALLHVVQPAAPDTYERVWLEAPGAVCLDGSRGAYYVRRGRRGSASKWHVHLMGGGWCASLDDCAERMQSDLGSSNAYPARITASGGYFSPDPGVNTVLADWTRVLVRYCDGSSWTSDRNTPVDAPGPLGTTVALHFRGRALMDATRASLLSHGMASASDVVLAGCSAGALGVLHHLDRWRAALPTGTRVTGLIDSGWFVEFNADVAAAATVAAAGGIGVTGAHPPHPTPHFGRDMRWLCNTMDCRRGVDASCAAASGDDPARCLFSERALRHVSTPAFVMQSAHDSWATEHILGADDPAAVTAFGTRTRSLVDAAVSIGEAGGAHGLYLDSCAHHCGFADGITVDGVDQAAAYHEWYTGKTSSGAPSNRRRWADTCPHPCASAACAQMPTGLGRRRRARGLFVGRDVFICE